MTQIDKRTGQPFPSVIRAQTIARYLPIVHDSSTARRIANELANADHKARHDQSFDWSCQR